MSEPKMIDANALTELIKSVRYCCLFCEYAPECYDDLIAGGKDHGE